MTLLFATNNPHKLREVQALLGSEYTLLTPVQCGVAEELPETAATLEGNARMKARALWNRVGRDCFADDTGLEVAALGGAPGVHSARYASPGHDNAANCALLLRNLRGADDRTAQFRTVICLILEGREHFFEGVVRGRIAETPSGEGGFGYDPLFIPEGCDRSFAGMSEERKNALSHRGRAVRAMQVFLEGLPTNP